MPDDRHVRARRAGRRGAGQHRERATIPGRAQGWRERRDLAGGCLEHRGELGLEHEQSLVRIAGVLPGRVAQRPDQPLAAGEAGRHARGEGGVGFAHQLVDVIKRRSLPGLAAITDQDRELVWVMQGRFDLEVSAATDQRPAAHQQLGEDRDRVSLGMRSDLLDDRAGQPVERVGGGRLGPGRRGGERDARGPARCRI